LKKTLLLLAGDPGTGKSYFDQMIRARISGFHELSIDVEKEFLYDKYGFNNLDDREKLDYEALQLYLEKVKLAMARGHSIISDYPFSNKQWGTLKRLSETYDFQVITVVLTADFEVLYNRQVKRDLDESRHLGHLMTHYHKGDVLQDRHQIEVKATKSELAAFLKVKKYDEFKLGTTFKLDVSDFEKVDYQEVIDSIDESVNENFFLSDYIDHTLLAPTTTKEEIKQVVMDAQKYEFHSVMVNPCWVKDVHSLLADSPIKTATVIGFPLGANTTTVKELEAENAIQNGADELDMVMNIGMFKSGDKDYVGEEIERIKLIAHSHHKILKVIIETSLLTDEEKKAAAQLVSAKGADFIKTSTGFSTGGATVKDVALLKKYVTGKTLVKASGGIHNRQEAIAMIDNGAARLGTSQSVTIVTET